MRVLLILLCIIVALLQNFTFKCTDNIIPKVNGKGVDSLTADRWRYFNCAVATYTTKFFEVASDIQYCGNETAITAAMMLKQKSSKYINLKIVSLLLASGVIIWNIMLRLKKPSITRKTILQKETELLAKFDHLRSILDAINVGVVSIDIQMKITFINSTAGSMCGCCPKLAKGKLIGDVMRFKDKNNEFTTRNILQILKKNHPMSEDTALELQSHNRRYLEVQQKVAPLLLAGNRVGAVILLLDVTVSQNLLRKLSYRASHDALTGLPNRASFEKRLRNTSINSEEKNLEHAIVFVDLDGFKKINDDAGHAAGDELLKQIARLMQSQLRHSDFVARLGGDEFGLVLFNCKLSWAKILISKLVNSVNEYKFCWEGEVKHIGASAGITNMNSRKTNISVLISEADTACYDAKRRGKGQVCVFESH